MDSNDARKGRDLNSSDLSPPVPVAIIGMGCMFPQAEDMARYWANIRKGIDAITDVPESHWRAADYFDNDPKAADRTYAHRGGFLTPVDFPLLEFGISPNSVEATDTTQLLGLMVARAALADAAYLNTDSLDRDKVSVILGVTGTLELVIPLGARLGHPIWRRALLAAGVDQATTDDVVKRISASYVGWQENSFPGLLGNVAAGRIANRLDLRGTNCVVDAACASSLGAVNLATLELAAGRCDLAVTGGLDTFNDIFMYMCFSKTPALSPTGDARPFDASADGTILGEGLGVLILKRLADARRDGDRIYAVIRSMGSSSDGKGQAVYAPSAAGQAQALRRAYQAAELSPATVELVEAHGTGTKVGDAIELAALEEVYRGARAEGSWCSLGSVKSQVGHTKAAAGAAGMIKAALALYHKVLPPTSKVSRPIEPLAGGESPFYLTAHERPWLPRPDHSRRAAVSAFGFGGSNFHCVLEEADAAKPGVDWDGDVQILPFSSDLPSEIDASLRALASVADWNQIRAQAARARARFVSGHRLRLVMVVVRGKDDLPAMCAAARARLQSLASAGPGPRPLLEGPARRTQGGPTIFLGTGPAQGQLAMLFPGQGSQYVGMLRELACQFPQMQQALALVNEVWTGDERKTLLSDCIYPPSAFDEATRGDQDLTLRDTRFAQPAIAAVSLGLLHILDSFGVRPQLTGGHSFGELTALCAAGRMDGQSLARLAQRRGAIMADCARDGAPGAMLAVFAPLDRVAPVLREHRLDVVIANKNAPRQCVLSGPAGEIARCQRLLRDVGVTTHPVAVSAAFHSELVAAAETPLRKTLDSIDVSVSAIPVLANTTAQPYPDDPDAARALLAGQLARPVEFVAQVESMYRMGARTFLEVGPDAKLTGMIHAILEGRDYVAVAVDSTRGAGGNQFDLACSLATLASVGYAVDLTRWDLGSHDPGPLLAKPGLTVKICGANSRTKEPASDHLPVDTQPARPAPKSEPLHTASPRTPRFSMARADNGIVPSHRPPPAQPEIDCTMNPPQGNRTRHTNGQASSHALPVHDGERVPAPRLSPALPPEAVPTQAIALTLALQNSQENLVALERMAEQTATLHRQFLEGQEKTQQIFLKLLDQEQRLSLGLLDSSRPPAAGGERSVSNLLKENDTSFNEPAPPVVRPVFPPAVGHSNGKPPITEALPILATHRPVQPVTTEQATNDRAAAVLIDVVADRTGYPAGVLDLDMQLDADLGIDSIKRVEILSAFQDRLPGLPALEPDQLASFRTLRAIVDFVSRSHAEVQHALPTPPASTPAPRLGRDGDFARLLVEIVADKTGYPADMLELDMRLDTDLGIDSIKRVEIFSAIQERLPDSRPAGPEQIGSLGTLGEIVTFLSESAPLAIATHTSPHESHAPQAGSSEPVERVLLESVADKTGYPIDMLELDMQLDTDLGIDSIKRVEILSAVQDRLPTVGSISPEQLGTLGTLRQIIEALAGQPAPPLAPASSHSNGRQSSSINTNGPAHRTGHQNGEMSHTSPDNGSVSTDAAVLSVLHPTVRLVPASDVRDQVGLRSDGTIWLTDDGSPLTDAVCVALNQRDYRCHVVRLDGDCPPDPDERLCGLIILAPSLHADDAFVRTAFRVLRAAGPALERSATRGGAALLSVTRLEGKFGLDGLAATASPTAGALAGMVKTAGHEWRGVHCKAVDLAPGLDSSVRTADVIVNELFQRGPAEVGLCADGRAAVELEPAKNGDGSRRQPVDLTQGDLVVVSGGARGVTAEVAVALAQSFRPRLVLLGRTPVPAAEPDWLAAIDDEAQIKHALLARSNGRRALHEVGAEVDRMMAQREIRGQLARIEAAGSPVVYRSVDVRDQAAVQAVMADVQGEFGMARGLIHGAGVLADRKIADQTDAQFDLVFDTKVKGLYHLYESLDPESLRFLILFSSSTARFGRAGQVAYAAANEALNKWAQQQSVRLPHCHVVSYNWGPWAGGMVKDSLRPMFEKEGLSLIPLDAGAHLVVDELRRGPGRVEVVVLAEPHTADRSPAGPNPEPPTHTPAEQKLERVFRRTVDVDSLPMLASHVIDAHAVLPMAIIAEWLAEGAAHRNPGLVVRGIDHLQLHKGVIAGKGQEATVEVRVGKAVRDGAQFIVPADLKGTLANGREVAHARANIILADRHETAPTRQTEGTLAAYPLSREEMYQTILFHGPALQGIERVDGLGERMVAGWVATSPAPSEWLEQPLRNIWLTDPLAIDCAFQLMVVWCRERLGANSLPTAIGGYRQYRRAFPADGVRVVAQIRHSSETRAIADIEFLDASGAVVARLDGYECVVDVSLNEAFRRSQLTPLLTLSQAE
jgi:acyl transferase domain-containing protein/NADP-dependent 3-hydroxy acid dehydrogenase YdfG